MVSALSPKIPDVRAARGLKCADLVMLRAEGSRRRSQYLRSPRPPELDNLVPRLRGMLPSDLSLRGDVALHPPIARSFSVRIAR